MAAPPYKLSCSIYGHNADVRAVAVTEDGKIISGSRDKTAKLWIPNELGSGFREGMTLTCHQNFVSCVCALPPNKLFPNGLIITGSNDKTIRLFDKVQNQPIGELKGHSNTGDFSLVCKIVPGADENTILSCSWDNTARMWNLQTLSELSVYSGHEAAVWAAVSLSCGVIATGSADKKIKVYNKNGSCLNTLTGHKDCVRDLAVAGAKEVLSCSNDATVMLWQVELGQCLNTYHGHGHFIYSIVSIDSSNFVTSSEDHTVKVWSNGELVESIPIPAVSVWCVSVLPNSDIVTGSSDGVLRVFSRDPSRQATPEELKNYEEQLANFNSSSSQDLSGINVSDLPGEEALFQPGKNDGQTLMIRKDNEVIAYSWSSSEGKWNLIGTVTGAVGDKNAETGRPTYNGKEYDYVFSVDIEPGKPLLKLPYNKTDDPWHAAQKFIHDNELSQQFLEEVANFIIRNSSQESVPTNTSSEHVDPFTGAARYIPSGNSTMNGFSGNQSSIHSNNSNNFIVNSYFPQREFLRFDQANLNLILEKLIEFNRKTGDGNQTISDGQIESLVKSCESGSPFRSENVETLTLLLKWSEELIFPVLDVMRLIIRNREANNYLCNDKLIPGLMKFLCSESKVSSNTMLALRVLSNMFAEEAGQALAEENKLKLLNILDEIPPPYSKPVQIAMSTLLLNLAVLIRKSETPVGRTEAIAVTKQMLPKLSDQEALFRAFVALGTLLVDTVDSKKHALTFTPIIKKYQSDSSLGDKIQNCCQCLLQVLQ